MKKERAHISNDDDIDDTEYEEYHLPYEDNLHNFMIKYIIPEVFAFQLSNSHDRGCLCNATLEQHCNSMCDIFNGFHRCLTDIKTTTVEVLHIKYNLTITNENPLILEKWQ